MLNLVLALVPQSAGGFGAGDLVVYDPSANGGAGLHRVIKPIDGTLEDLDYGATQASTAQDLLAYDAARDRLIFGGGFGGGTGIHAGTRGGSFSTLVEYPGLPFPGCFAPTGDGRIYFSLANATGSLRYVDAAGVVHIVEDGAGSPYVPAQLNAVNGHMEYDPGSNSLVWAAAVSTSACTAGGGRVFVGKAVLNEAGTDVISTECTSIVTVPDPTNGDVQGLTLLEPGRLLVFSTTGNLSAQYQPAIHLIETEGGPGGTLATSLWADLTIGLGSGGSQSGMTFSVPRQEAVLLGHFFDTLSGVPEGATSTTIFTPSGAEITNSNVGSLTDIRSVGFGGLQPDGDSLSILSGGTQGHLIDFGPASAFDFYAVLGSFSGFAPLSFAGVEIPLELDGYTNFTLASPNSGPLVNSLGVLDANGRAAAAIVLPPSAPAALIGVVAHHAAVRISSLDASVQAATNAVSLTFTP